MNNFTFCLGRWLKKEGDLILTWRNELYNIPAVYVIYGNEEIIYIGQSSIPKSRFFCHKIIKVKNVFITPWGKFVDLYIKIKYSKRYGIEAMIEKRLIHKLKPRFNKNNIKFNKCPEFI